MLELLIKTKPQAVKSFFKIDFTDAEVGSQVLPVSSQTPVNLQRVIRNADNSDGVVDHPTYGKCYRFTGNVFFQETNASSFLNLIPRPKFKLTMKFVTSGARSVPFYTGTATTGKNGLQLYTWSTSPKWGWVTVGAGARQMNLDAGAGAGTPIDTVIEMVLEKSNDTYFLTANGIANSSYQGPGFSTVDSTLCIGSSAENPFYFPLTGYLLSLEITI